MKLLELSREKGFMSRDNLIGVSESYYYLWMCELQKWLREEHQIHIKITVFEDGTWAGDLIYKDAEYEWDDPNAPYDADDCKSYEKVLEICLIKALEII